jgi:hypothetical protein
MSQVDLPRPRGARGAAGALARGAACVVVVVGVVGVVAACAPGTAFPADVQRAFRDEPMRRLETDHLVLLYPARRHALVERFAARAEPCAADLRRRALHRGGIARDKLVIAMPEVAFNNAYVAGKLAGSPDVAVVPTLTTLDFTTLYGMPPDPGFVACHELTHYVHMQQVRGLWGAVNRIAGDLYTPQLGHDAWFIEGLAVHYESSLSPSAGRLNWPVFRGMLAAAYAGKRIRGGDLSEHAREATVGHHYLVGAAFVRFLAERYGEAALWRAIHAQAGAWTGLLAPRALRRGLGKPLPALLDELNTWLAERVPVRPVPPGQARLATLGSDARYARGLDGTEAWVAGDLDRPARLVVRGPRGEVRADLALTGLLPPRTLAIAAPQRVSGLSITADGEAVWLTAVDRGATATTTRLLRWRARDGLREVATGLGPGGAIDPTGQRYYYLPVDGDRWSLAEYDVASGARRALYSAAPGTYVLSAQVSPDGRTIAASAWNGRAFVVWIFDAERGDRLRELTAVGPLYDPAFLDDGRLVCLATVDGRFQAQVWDPDGGGAPRTVTDAPYAVLAPRGSGSRLRFLSRAGWRWELAEVALPAPAEGPPRARGALGRDPGEPDVVDVVDEVDGELDAPATRAEAGGGSPARWALGRGRAYSAWTGFGIPRLRAPWITTAVAGDPHVGLVLGGFDRLGSHAWLVAGAAQVGERDRRDQPYLGGELRYRNDMLAPWSISATARAYRGRERRAADSDPAAERPERRTADAALLIGRAWRASWSAEAGAVYTANRVDSPSGALERRLGGPTLALAYAAAEGAPYTGAARKLGAQLTITHFPAALSSLSAATTSVRAGLTGAAPLPGSRRHLVEARAAGHAMVRPADVIEVGGSARFTPLVTESSQPTAMAPAVGTPPNLRLLEPLRGYEDLRLTAARVVAGELSWRYPIPIDRGSVTTLWLLPASFVRQIDLDLFAAGALTQLTGGATREHLAVGGGLTLRLHVTRLPMALRYQAARRLRDDRAWAQLLGLGLGL